MHWIDRAASLALRWAPARYGVFPDGLGGEEIDRLLADAPTPETPIEPIELEWETERSDDGRARSIARFHSPFALELPPSARTAIVERTDPPGGSDRCFVLLQMWGDEGFSLRRKLADRLAERGISTLLTIHPFYGRRRVHSEGPPVRTVEEFLRMGLGSILEVRSLLDHLRADHRVGLGGFSMGSGFSVGASTSLPFPVALALMGSAPSPRKAFTEGVLVGGLPERLRGPDRDRLADVLEAVGALSRPVLPHHRRAVLLAALGDGFVPIDEAEALAEHWKGAELRRIRGGHATLWFLRPNAMVDAIVRAFERHEQR